MPNSWSKYPSEFIGLILYSEVKAHYQKNNTIEGTEIQIDRTCAVLCIHEKQIWLKNKRDTQRKPSTRKYLEVFMPCIKTTES